MDLLGTGPAAIVKTTGAYQSERGVLVAPPRRRVWNPDSCDEVAGHPRRFVRCRVDWRWAGPVGVARLNGAYQTEFAASAATRGDKSNTQTALMRPSDIHDTLPEWSKGVDSSSTSASCVGSNPTGVICLLTNGYRHRNNTASVTKRRLVQVPTNNSDQRKAIEMSVCPSG